MTDKRKRDKDFFVLTEKPGSHHAFMFWLEEREFNDFEIGKPDKHGNAIIKIYFKYDETDFDKRGIVCCMNVSEDIGIALIEKHLERLTQNERTENVFKTN